MICPPYLKWPLTRTDVHFGRYSAADIIVTMGCGDACPVVAGTRYLDWDLPDPAGRPLDVVCAVRDDLTTRVLALLADLTPDTVDAKDARS